MRRRPLSMSVPRNVLDAGAEDCHRVRMRVHHLNCGTMRPLASPEPMVCHVLVVETPDGLVVVDTGFGTRDREEWRTRLGSSQHLLRPAYDDAETLVRQLEHLGLRPADVTDVLLTHFDADHVGGLVDLPQARVHLSGDERDAVLTPRTRLEKARYLPGTRAHGPQLVSHDPAKGEGWRGFPAATEVVPGVVLIAMPGHTRGHCAVAVDAGHRWVLHAGDTFYHRGQVGDPDPTPRVLAGAARLTAHDPKAIVENRDRLTELVAAGDDLLVVNAHDATLLERALATASPSAG